MKKINKRTCRPFADPHLKMDPNNGLLISDKYSYIVRTAVKIIAGQKLLLIYIYSREQAASGQQASNRQQASRGLVEPSQSTQGQSTLGRSVQSQLDRRQPAPLFTIFQSKTEHCTLARKADGSSVWFSSRFKNLNSDYFFEDKCTFYTVKDQERMEAYCSRLNSYKLAASGLSSNGLSSNGLSSNGLSPNGFRSLIRLQDRIGERRREENQKAKDRNTIQRMSTLPSLPRGLNNWIRRNIMTAFLFYDYQKKKGAQKAYCTSCQKEVEITGAKYKAETVCPNCKRKVIFKSRGKRGPTWDCKTCQVIQKTGPNELVIRIIKAIYFYSDKDEPKINIYENARFFVSTGENDKYLSKPYYYSYTKGILTKWQSGYRPSINAWQRFYEPDICGYLYPEKLNEALHDTKWQYCQLREFALNLSEPFTVADYLETYLHHPLLEYLVKLRLYRLATYLIFHYYSFDRVLNLEGRNIREVLGIEKKDLPYIQSLDPDGAGLIFIKAVTNSIGTPNKELIAWCFSHNFHDADIIKYLLAFVTPHKLIHYADIQFSAYAAKKAWTPRMENLLLLYRDYVRMCNQLDYDLNNDFVLFPRYLEKSHDQLSTRIRKGGTEIYDQRIKSLYPILKKQYQFEHKGFLIIPPQTAQEITHEGHTLRHCVGSYLDSVAASDCVILFIRNVKRPRKPLCTVEIRNNKVKQARCRNNQEPSAEIKDFISHWEKKVLSIPEKKWNAA